MLARWARGRSLMVLGGASRNVAAFPGRGAVLAQCLPAERQATAKRWSSQEAGERRKDAHAGSEGWSPTQVVDVNELLINSMPGRGRQQTELAEKRRELEVRLLPEEVQALFNELLQPKAPAKVMEERLLKMRERLPHTPLPLELHWMTVKAFVDERQVDEAKRVLLDVHRLTGHDDAGKRTYHMVLRELCQRGQMQEAIKIFHDACAEGKWQKWHSVALLLLEGCYVSGQYDTARELLQEMVSSGGLRGSTLGPFVGKAVEAGRVHTAERIAEDMTRFGQRPRPQIYAALMSHYSRLGDVEAVDRLANQMREVGTPHTRFTYGYLVKVRAWAGRLDEALELFEKMPEQGFRPQTSVYNILVRELAAAGRLEEAEDVLRKMKAKDVPRGPRIYSDLSAGFAKHGQTQRSMAILQEDLPGDGLALEAGYLAVVHKAACIAGNVEFAHTLERAFPEHVGPYCIRQVAAAHVSLGQFEEMLKGVVEMRLQGPQGFVQVKGLLSNLVLSADGAGRGEELMGYMDAVCKSLQLRPLVFLETLLTVLEPGSSRYQMVFQKAVKEVPASAPEDVQAFACRLAGSAKVEELGQLLEAVPQGVYLSNDAVSRSIVSSINVEKPEQSKKVLEAVKVMRRLGRDTNGLYFFSVNRMLRMGMTDVAKEIAGLQELGQVQTWLESHLEC